MVLASVIVTLTITWVDVTGYTHQYVYPEATQQICEQAAHNFLSEPDGNMTQQDAMCGVIYDYKR
jgi:hypothetical protein